MERKGKLEIFELASVLRVGGISSKMLDTAQKMADDFKEWHKPGQIGRWKGALWVIAFAVYLGIMIYQEWWMSAR